MPPQLGQHCLFERGIGSNIPTASCAEERHSYNIHSSVGGYDKDLKTSFH